MSDDKILSKILYMRETRRKVQDMVVLKQIWHKTGYKPKNNT